MKDKREYEKQIKEIIAKHTQLIFSNPKSKCVRLRFVVDHQSFDMGEYDSVKKAKWFQRMLAIAIQRMIEQNK